MIAAAAILLAAKVWVGIGALVTVPFLLWGIDRVDPDAEGAHVFRPLLIPGILLLWPLVLWRWSVLAAGRDRWSRRHAPPRDVHRVLAAVLAGVLAVTLGTALALRQSWLADVAPVRLAEPAAR